MLLVKNVKEELCKLVKYCMRNKNYATWVFLVTKLTVYQELEKPPTITKTNIKSSLLKIFTKFKILVVNKGQRCIQNDFETYCRKNGFITAVAASKRQFKNPAHLKFTHVNIITRSSFIFYSILIN